MEGTSTVLSIWKEKCYQSPEIQTFKALSLSTSFEKLESNLLCHDDGLMEISLSSCPNGPWPALDGLESSDMCLCNLLKKKLKKSLLTDTNFEDHAIGNTHIYFFCLTTPTELGFHSSFLALLSLHPYLL
jgi:hypothetical protein